MTRRKYQEIGAAAAALLLLLFCQTEAKAGAVGKPGELPGFETEYLVEFVDADDYGTRIFNSQQGTVKDGETVEVSFPERIIGSDGHIWSSLLASPRNFTVNQSGTYKYYVEYRKGEEVESPEEPEDSGKEKLEQWLEKAWEADCRLNGQSPDSLRDPYLSVKNKEESERRIKNLVSMVGDNEWHYFYMIGRDYIPEAKVIGVSFDAAYSAVEEDSFVTGKHKYCVVRIGVKRNWQPENCTHSWECCSEVPSDCLKMGEVSWRCEKCRKEETVFLPALNHLDQNQDSLCDRCRRRVFGQELGSRIMTTLQTKSGPQVLSFTCIDLDYKETGNMLYLADQVLKEDITGQCFLEADYNPSPIRRYLNEELENADSLLSALQLVEREDGDGIADAALLLSLEEQEFYTALGRIAMAGHGYFLRTGVPGEDSLMYAVSRSGTVVKADIADGELGVRPAILLERPETGEVPERLGWKRGDIQMRRLGGQVYRFYCIDEDYSGQNGGHKKEALFLCDSVIRSDIDSDSFAVKRFCFGLDNNYKTSDIRRWLNENSSASGEWFNFVSIGIGTAYTGSTEEGTRGQLEEASLAPFEIGFQLVQDSVFCLSLEEALRYRNELWRFDSSEDNPDAQISACSQGYYLRTPFYVRDDTGRFCYSDAVYAVDLVKGNIHTVKTGSETFGIRPAYALSQE